MIVRTKLRKIVVLAACLCASLSSSMGAADPLHQFGNEGAWRHEHSGWQFAKQVGGFTRVMAPYTIDGNNDVGVRYERAAGEPRLAAVVEVYLADSAAPDAKLSGAKTSAKQKAGDSARIQSEQPFQISGREALRGTKVTYVGEKSTGAQTSLYFFETDRWAVKVLGSTETAGKDAGKVLDAFVRALPWDTLGDPTALH